MGKIESLEYSLGGRAETPFQTFLRHTDEKPQSAKVLGQVLEGEMIRDGMHVLDIGSGTGEYLRLALDQFVCPTSTRFTLLEPSLDLQPALLQEVGRFPNPTNVEVVTTPLETYEPKQTFDIAIGAHLYHIKSDQRTAQFSKMLELVRAGGTLIYVLRGMDDAYDFKMRFKPRLFNADFQAQTLEDNLQTFQQLSEQSPLEITTLNAHASVQFPLDNMGDTQAIIEFFLNKRWSEIPDAIQEEALQFIRAKNGIFRAIDGIARIKKK